jgi:hypothetical protein
MANPNPRTDNLELGRGKKPQLGHKAYKLNLAPAVRRRLDKIAEAYDCTYAGKGSLSILLTKIADNRLMISPTLSYSIQEKLDQDLVDGIDEELGKDLIDEIDEELDRDLVDGIERLQDRKIDKSIQS